MTSLIRQRQSGFGLIEVLVAVVVIAIGLLGIAKMHALALGNTRVSGSRAIATLYAGSLSSAMHANPGYWQAAGTATTGVSTTANSANTAVTLSDATLNTSTGTCVFTVAADAGSGCSPTQMAAADLRAWGLSLLQLPNGTGNVACTNNTTVPVTCTITISWSEKYIAANAAGVNAGAQSATATLVVLVQP